MGEPGDLSSVPCESYDDSEDPKDVIRGIKEEILKEAKHLGLGAPVWE
jgi:hypothetical protein